MAMTIFWTFSFAITAAIILWELADPHENTKMFLSIPSIAILTFSYIVLSTNWQVFGQPLDNLRILLAGLVAIPYVISSGFAYFIRVYSYMWDKAQQADQKQDKKNRKKSGISIEQILSKK